MTKMKSFLAFHLTKIATYATIIVLFTHNALFEREVACTCKNPKRDCWMYISVPVLMIMFLLLWMDKFYIRTCSLCHSSGKYVCAAFLQMVKAFVIGLLWVVYVLMDGDWYACCKNIYNGTQNSIACKDRASRTPGEQATIDDLKNKSKVIGVSTLLIVLFLVFGYSSRKCCKVCKFCKQNSSSSRKKCMDNCCDGIGPYEVFILKEGENTVMQILKEKAKEDLTQKVGNIKKEDRFFQDFDAVDELIDELRSPKKKDPGANRTGLIDSEIFTRHNNLLDTSNVERPKRVTFIKAALQREKLLSLCVNVEPREATEEELLLFHRKEYLDAMKKRINEKQQQNQNCLNRCKCQKFLKVCKMAVGSVLQLVDRVLTSELKNGFAVIRPPGHYAKADISQDDHAQAEQPNEANQDNQDNDFCVFNNVAIAAQYAQRRHAVSRVLIVDWDVHHGQGIQNMFEKYPGVLYFSIHKYNSSSEADAFGSRQAPLRNINLPWYKTGMSDADYIAAFQQVLLPVACEFQPQLVLVSAGFDAVAGDPERETHVSPQCFHILTHMLMGLAEGRLILALEEGYNLERTADGVAACVRALLGGACPPLNPPTAPSDRALQSISRTISTLYPHGASLQVRARPATERRVTRAETNQGSSRPASINVFVAKTTGLVYDEKMMEHMNWWERHPEQPQRTSKILLKHQQLGLVNRCHWIPSRLATEEELDLCHSQKHNKQITATREMKSRYQGAQLAAGSCFNAVDSILNGQVNNGVVIISPSGYNVERDYPCSFCLFNTTALTARYAQRIYQDSPPRILIVDWDIHHGNGTQHMFEDDDSVLYISLHRYDNGTFFPFSKDAAADQVGVAKGAGYNVNVAWSGGRMGDSDYLAAFHHVVMPIATEFNPSLVLVSAWFDAARGDPLGGYQVTPEGYAYLTHMLMSLAGGRVLMILEGGYNLPSISDSMAMCTSVLLGDPPPSLVTPLPAPHPYAVDTITNVIHHHAPYWKSLRINIPESAEDVELETLPGEKQPLIVNQPEDQKKKKKKKKKKTTSDP